MADRIESLISNQRELTNAVSHELRTPISRLSFELEQLNKQVDAEVRHDLIEDMRADLGELEEMVSELLTYARLEHGNVGSHRKSSTPRAGWIASSPTSPWKPKPPESPARSAPARSNRSASSLASWRAP